MKKLWFLCVAGLFLLCLSAEAGEWREIGPGDAVKLPSDLYYQSAYRIQWWYFTGHLHDARKREFGYELTFFTAGVQRRKYESQFGVNTIYLSHFAVSDIEGKKFYQYSNADSGAYGFAGAESGRLQVWVDKDSLEGNLNKMHIKAYAKEAELDLVLIPRKPLVLNGDRGYSRKSEESPLIASLYFSSTDLETTGTVKVGDAFFPVHGKSWFDREISSRGLAKNEAGWDWFALQLDDGQEIMLYLIRKKDGSTGRHSSGTLVYNDGSFSLLAKDDFNVTVMKYYTSTRTKKRYPSQWEITIPRENLKLLVTPFMEDQEFTGGEMRGGAYWEGACRIEGSVQGRAYVEMTGYE
jgi:predicted secreted hydrolase